MEFKIITRGNSSVIGKAKIFIAYYGKDTASIIITISKWILNLRNCAIFYPDPKCNFENNSYHKDLDNMQCIVIPVFVDILYKDSPCIEILTYAVAHHIPIIPIMMEKEESPAFYQKYNQFFGDTQLLFPYLADNTKVSFVRQLEIYFSRIFPDDLESYERYQTLSLMYKELNKKIIESFRGSIFISYRKKNRKYIESFLQSIHEDRELTDIMLWYDEFLVIGEDYSEELETRIKNCDLFLMLITSSMLENGNYVRTHEYPLAIKYHRPVMAVAVENIDETEVKNIFPEIMLFVSLTEINNTNDYLRDMFSQIKGAQKELKREQMYFLGKAYMDGQYVEINRKLGIHFIELAAKARYIPAIKQMSEYYRIGNGVETNTCKQLQWQNFLVEAIKTDRLSTDHIHTADWMNLSKSYEKQGDICLLEGRLTECIVNYKNMLATILKEENSVMGSWLPETFVSHELIAYNKLANACIYTNDLREARSYLNKALIRYKETEDVEYVLGGEIAICSIWINIGKLERLEGNFNLANESYKKVLDFVKDFPKTPYLSNAYFHIMCDIYEELGKFHSDQNNLQTAFEMYEMAYMYAQKYDAEHSSLDSRKFIVSTANHLVNFFLHIDDIERAMDYLKTAADVANSVFDEEQSASSYTECANLNLQLGKLLYEKKQLKMALTYLKRVEKCHDRCTYLSVSSENKGELYTLLGNIAYIEKRPALARSYYKKLIDIRKEQFEHSRDYNNLMNLGNAYYKLSTAHEYTDDWDSMQNACDIYSALAYGFPNDNYAHNLKNNIQCLIKERQQRVQMQREHLKAWSLRMQNIAQQLEDMGIQFGGQSNFFKVFVTDILSIICGIVDNIEALSEETALLISYELNITLELKELQFLLYMQKFYFDKIPESIKICLTLSKKINHTSDYHESIAYSLRNIVYVLGCCLIDRLNAEEKKKMFTEYIDKIDLYIETNWTDSVL